jgi:hypothetical protein
MKIIKRFLLSFLTVILPINIYSQGNITSEYAYLDTISDNFTKVVKLTIRKTKWKKILNIDERSKKIIIQINVDSVGNICKISIVDKTDLLTSLEIKKIRNSICSKKINIYVEPELLLYTTKDKLFSNGKTLTYTIPIKLNN